MSYQVLARKWRPKKFQDVIGQEHITKSFQNAIVNNRLGHAYLLSGTRGIGKTSIARIFAKSLRCLDRLEDGNPCHRCEACIDFDSQSSMNFSEIDGASNNSVDNMRELINNVHYLPSTGKYKIYLIDEVHMLSSNAFNALLKTLEEPPAHVVFILATTEPEKLLETVLSRCQRFEFRNASVKDLAEHLKKIADAEEIKFESEKLISIIAKQGRGSVRDTLSLLDQVLSFSSGKNIDEKTVALSLGLASTSAIKQVFESLISGDVAGVSKTYNTLLSQNVKLNNILTSLIEHTFEVIEHIDDGEYLSSQALVDTKILEDVSMAELIWVFESLSKDSTWIMDSPVPDKAFHILLQKLTLRREFLMGAKRENKKKRALTEPEVIVESGPESIPVAEKVLSWPGFLDFLSKKSPAMGTYVAHGNLMSEVDFNKADIVLSIELGFRDKDHLMHDFLIESPNKEKLKGVLSDYSGRPVEDFNLEIKLLKNTEAEEMKFRSVADIEKEEKIKEDESKKNKFLNEPIIVEAQKIFNSKMDRVVLKDRNK